MIIPPTPGGPGDSRQRRRVLRVAVPLLLTPPLALLAAGRLAPAQVSAAQSAVTIKDFSFQPSQIHVRVGESVTWTNRETNGQTHTVISDGGQFSSDGDHPNDPAHEIQPGASFSRSFGQDNQSYPYHCRLHTYMTGVIVVGKGSPPGQAPPPPPPPQPEPTPTPAPGPGGLPLPPLPPLPPAAPPASSTVRTAAADPSSPPVFPGLPPVDAPPATGSAPPPPDGTSPARGGSPPAAGPPPVADTSPASGGAPAAAAGPRPAYQPTELPQGRPAAGTLGDGTRLADFTVDRSGVKVFHLRMAPVPWTPAPGLTMTAYAFNGTIPGPVIRINEGDRVRITVENDLPVPTGVHWHGMILPNDQDGVPGITQPEIAPGTSYTYQWTALAPGTHWYHTHSSGKEVGLGLYGPLEVVPREGDIPADRDYRIMVGDTYLGMVLNGRTFPYTIPLQAKVGDRVHIRLFDAGDQIHPIHLHGFPFQLVAQDGHRLAVPQLMDTILIGTGQTYDLLWQPTSPGHWLLHCHIFAHSHDEHGMTGLVTTLDVAPADGRLPALPPLPAPPPPDASGLGSASGPTPAAGLLPSATTGTLLAGQPLALLGGHEEAVLMAVGLLVAFRLGRRAGGDHDRPGQGRG
jgi:manganese oxidase